MSMLIANHDLPPALRCLALQQHHQHHFEDFCHAQLYFRLNTPRSPDSPSLTTLTCDTILSLLLSLSLDPARPEPEPEPEPEYDPAASWF